MSDDFKVGQRVTFKLGLEVFEGSIEAIWEGLPHSLTYQVRVGDDVFSVDPDVLEAI